MTDTTPYQILVVEDNLADTRLLQLLFSDCEVPTQLHILRDGTEASDFLMKSGRFHRAPTPDLVLLDLNLPRKDGWQILKEVRAHPHHRRTPVVMLSTSNNDREIAEAYDLGASAFISKPIELEAFRQAIHDLCRFWFRHVKLASRFALPPLQRTA
jgi:CheY-like chemotaxis protein